MKETLKANVAPFNIDDDDYDGEVIEGCQRSPRGRLCGWERWKEEGNGGPGHAAPPGESFNRS